MFRPAMFESFDAPNPNEFFPEPTGPGKLGERGLYKKDVSEVLHQKWTLFVGIDQRRRLARAKIDTLLLEVPRHAGEELLHDRNQ